MSKMTTIGRPGYTLIEIMMSVTLSLLLLLGVTQMFRNVGDTINETQATLNMGANLNSTAIVLRNDLGGIEDAIARKASDLVTGTPNSSNGGYLEIIEGQGAPPDVINTAFDNTLYSTSNDPSDRHIAGKHLPLNWTAYTSNPDYPRGDLTVTDNDDILAFTVNNGNFRGLVDDGSSNGKPIAHDKAEVTWFVRGTNLYRRVLLVFTDADLQKHGAQLANRYERQDISFRRQGGTTELNLLGELERREYRFGRPNYSPSNFPFSIHAGKVKDSWYYLGMPTVEETVHSNWQGVSSVNLNRTNVTCNGIDVSKFPDGATWGVGTKNQFWDFWDAPNDWSDLDPVTGSLKGSAYNFVTTPRSPRAGEDIILTNVIGFDVKVWNPYWVPCYDDTPAPGANESPGPTTSSANGAGDAWKWAPPQFVDLGQDSFYLPNATNKTKKFPVNYQQRLDGITLPPGIPAYHATNVNVAGYGFTLKGRYNTIPGVRRTLAAGTTDKWHEADRLESSTTAGTYHTWGSTHMSCVYDSWCNDPAYITTPIADGNGNTVIPAPPYTEPIKGIQVTIRCFEPQSGTIKQIRITRFFN